MTMHKRVHQFGQCDRGVMVDLAPGTYTLLPAKKPGLVEVHCATAADLCSAVDRAQTEAAAALAQSRERAAGTTTTR